MSIRSKVLACISTYASAPYVDITLTNLKKWNIQAVVFDDGSSDTNLLKVCIKHGVTLIGLHNVRRGHYCGDFYNTYLGMKTALDLGYIFCMKISRRWIPLIDPIPSLEKLYIESKGYTYSNATRPNFKDGFGFRTDTFVTVVEAYKDILPDMLTRANNNDIGLVEARMHNYARKIQPKDSMYVEYMKKHPTTTDRDGYIHWDWLGSNSTIKIDTRLQPEVTSLSEYCTIANNLGLNYKPDDFKI